LESFVGTVFRSFPVAFFQVRGWLLFSARVGCFSVPGLVAFQCQDRCAGRGDVVAGRATLVAVPFTGGQRFARRGTPRLSQVFPPRTLSRPHALTPARPHVLTQAAIVYYGAAVFLHYVVPFFMRRNLASVQKGRREENQVRREALASLGPLFVKSVIWSVVDWLVVVRKSQEGSHEGGGFASWVTVHDGEMGGIASLVGTVVLLDVLHDTWFYWTHRLLHMKVLYRRVHSMHHESRYVGVASVYIYIHTPSQPSHEESPPSHPSYRDACRVPTAFTGYSFHVLEAIIVFFNEILVCFFLPIHTRVHRYYHMYTTVIHCGGHAGYEIAPYVPSLQGLCSLLLTKGKVNGYLTTVEHHDLHHQMNTVHFGLYFQIWDRLMGTGVRHR
jgi:sterol desaturase/sphingolipid hydroxylase (fatty acid hydroxylase superfamily)